MEYQELIGSRRSIRFFDPERQVEPEKIQKILEACLIASCAVNAHWLRAIVVNRDDIPKAELQKMKSPTQALIIELAPVHHRARAGSYLLLFRPLGREPKKRGAAEGAG